MRKERSGCVVVLGVIVVGSVLLLASSLEDGAEIPPCAGVGMLVGVFLAAWLVFRETAILDQNEDRRVTEGQPDQEAVLAQQWRKRLGLLAALALLSAGAVALGLFWLCEGWI